MIILLVIVVVIYLILAIIFRDKNVNPDVDDEVTRKFVLDYLAKKQISEPAVLGKVVEYNQHNHGMNLLTAERTKRRIINETFLLGVKSGTQLRDKRDKYIQIK